MIIKHTDIYQAQIDYLTELLDRELPDTKIRPVKRALRTLYPSYDGQESAAEVLDNVFKESKDWALIHNLCLPSADAHFCIEHLLISRKLDVYIIDSSNYYSDVEIGEQGEFYYYDQSTAIEITSPINSNEEKIKQLKVYLESHGLYPKRLGAVVSPSYYQVVLTSDQTNLKKPKKGLYDCSAVMACERFLSRIKNEKVSDEVNSLVNMNKIITTESLKLYAEKLAYQHQRLEINYQEIFSEGNDEPDCPLCDKKMIARKVKKGNKIGDEFWGCIDYPKCKGTRTKINKPETKVINQKEKLLEIDNDDAPLCKECNKVMVKRISKQGKNKGKYFWGCSGFPVCKATQVFKLKTDEKPAKIQSELVLESVDGDEPLCPKCQSKMVKRESKKDDGKKLMFWGCTSFPKCRGVLSIKNKA